MSRIILQNISKSYGEKIVLNNFSAEIPLGCVYCITGPSGSGKTTLLRIIAGLECEYEGEVIGSEYLKKSMVFQEDRLCVSITAGSNIKLVNPKLSDSEVLEAMEAVGLGDCFGKSVSELSGGMARRVAVLRAALAEYDILLMDEPFRGLDESARAMTVREVKKRATGRTVIMVTHLMFEADEMGTNHLVKI